MTGLRIPPGRAGALWLRRRIAVATRGCELLRQKLLLLDQEERRLRLLAEATATDWRVADRRARERLLRAALLGGGLPVVGAARTASADATLRWSTVMGVRYPAEPALVTPEPSSTSPPPGGMALAGAVAAYRQALLAAVRHAAAAAALRAVETEAALTRQRVRALERRWLPRLRVAQAAIALQMAELEDADSVRRRRAAQESGATRSKVRVS